MRKIDVIFFIFIICLAVPFIKFFDLNQDRDRFVLAGKFRAEAVDLNTFPRKGIIDRNGNELAVDILRSTLIFENSIERVHQFYHSQISWLETYTKYEYLFL